jgi:hypothetical protein
MKKFVFALLALAATSALEVLSRAAVAACPGSNC